MKVFLGLGSNINDRKMKIEKAIGLLAGSVEILKVSSYYEGEALEHQEQRDFVNVVLEGETDLEPAQLLDLCKRLEKKMGRAARFRYGPREIDIDLLLYADVALSSVELTIPHPKLLERRFVLEPLIEIEPDLKLPDGRQVSDFLVNVCEQRLVRMTI